MVKPNKVHTLKLSAVNRGAEGDRWVGEGDGDGDGDGQEPASRGAEGGGSHLSYAADTEPPEAPAARALRAEQSMPL